MSSIGGRFFDPDRKLTQELDGRRLRTDTIYTRYYMVGLNGTDDIRYYPKKKDKVPQSISYRKSDTEVEYIQRGFRLARVCLYNKPGTYKLTIPPWVGTVVGFIVNGGNGGYSGTGVSRDDSHTGYTGYPGESTYFWIQYGDRLSLLDPLVNHLDIKVGAGGKGGSASRGSDPGKIGEESSITWKTYENGKVSSTTFRKKNLTPDGTQSGGEVRLVRSISSDMTKKYLDGIHEIRFKNFAEGAKDVPTNVKGLLLDPTDKQNTHLNPGILSPDVHVLFKDNESWTDLTYGLYKNDRKTSELRHPHGFGGFGGESGLFGNRDPGMNGEPGMVKLYLFDRQKGWKS